MKTASLLLLLTVALSSALAGETAVRPNLLLGPEDIPRLRERAAREPYARFYRTCLRWLEEGVKPHQPEIDPILIRTQIGGLVSLISGDTQHARAARRPYMERIRSWAREIPAYRRDERRNSISLFVSRQLQNLCLDFDLLEPSGVFTNEESAEIQHVLGMVAARLMERGNSFNPYDYTQERFRPDNWNTDRLAAVGMFALTFPSDARSEGWRTHAVDELKWQLEHALQPDGAWPEGTRYHGAVLRSIVPFAHALQRQTEENLFQHPRFKALISSWISLQTPPISAAGGVALMPGINDANWENIWESVLAWAAPAYQETDPVLAGRLMQAWRLAGSPFVVEFSPGNPAMGLLLIDDGIASATAEKRRSELTPGGYAILRDDSAAEGGSWFLLNLGLPQLAWQHRHHDRGSFSLIAERTLLAVDPGVADYDASLREWYARGMAHNQVTFSSDDNSDVARVIDHCFGPDVDYVAAELRPAKGIVQHRRVFFIKPYDYLIWDSVRGEQAGTFNLHVLGRQVQAATPETPTSAPAERVTFRCDDEIDLDVIVVSPQDARRRSLLEITSDRHPVSVYVERNGAPVVAFQTTPAWLRLRQPSPREDPITVLSPRGPGAARLRVLNVRRDVAGGKERAASATMAELLCGSRRITLYLGSQTADGVVLEGDAAVVVQPEPAAATSVLLYRTTRFKLGTTHEFNDAVPRTLVLRERDLR